MTIQLELDLQFKTSYIFDLLDLLHEVAKRGSKLSFSDKLAIYAHFSSLRSQLNDLTFYAYSAGFIDSSHSYWIQKSILSSISLFWS